MIHCKCFLHAMSAVHRYLIVVSRIETDGGGGRARDWRPALGRALFWSALNCPMRDSIPILKRLLANERLRLTIRKQILRALVFIPSSEVGPRLMLKFGGIWSTLSTGP